MDRRLVLVKHALPELQAGVAPRHWQLGADGQAGAKRLSMALAALRPLRLEHSLEPKAAQTAERVALELGVARHGRPGFEEIDRGPQPILQREAHVAFNARLFTDPTRAVVGTESAESALARFEAAIEAALEDTGPTENLVVITHGTVIALFVAAHDAVDAFTLWQRLSCPAFVVLGVPGYALLELRGAL